MPRGDSSAKGRPLPEAAIRQEELEILSGLELLIRQRWNLYDRLASSIAQRLRTGAPVEAGNRSARLRVQPSRGRPRILLLDGIPVLPPMETTIRKAAPRATIKGIID